jgi:hypothetical protein
VVLSCIIPLLSFRSLAGMKMWCGVFRGSLYELHSVVFVSGENPFNSFRIQIEKDFASRYLRL